MSKPVLLLDIDGVVNAISRDFPRYAWGTLLWQTAEYPSNGELFPLMWSRPVIEYLGSLYVQDRVEIRWHTTWQEEAHEFASIVGLPEGFASIAKAPERMSSPGIFARQQFLAGKPAWWKYPAAERVLVEEKRPLIWIDDEIHSKINERYRANMLGLGDVCLVCPNQQTGITRKHMRIIEEFLLKMEEPGGALSGS